MRKNPLAHFLWAIPIVLFAPVLFFGRLLYYGTVSLQFVPWRWFGWTVLQSGEMPLWNVLLGYGSPLAANYQSAFFYPLNWLQFLGGSVGGIVGLTWVQGFLVVLHLALAAWGMAKLGGALGFGRLAQVASGLSYGLSGYLVARSHFLSINAATAWLPWILLYCYLLLRSNGIARKKNALWLTISLSLLLLAGHAQTAWYTLLLALIWSVFWAIRRPDGAAHSHSEGESEEKLNREIPGLIWIGLAGAAALLISAVQLLPTAELLMASQRAGGADEAFVMTYSFWPWRFLGLMLPSFFGNPSAGGYWGYANFWEDAVYIGLIPFFMAIKAIFNRKEQGGDRPLVFFLVSITLISFLLALGQNTPVFPYLYKYVPTFDLFQAPTRFSLWAVLSLSLLAGVGMQAWASTISTLSRRQAGRWMSVGLAFVFAGISVMVFLPQIEASFARSVLIAGLIGFAGAALGLARKRSVWWRFAVLMLISVDLAIAGWGLNPGVDASFYREAAPNRMAIKEKLSEGRLFLFSDDSYALTFDIYYPFDEFRTDTRGLRSSLLPNLNLLDGIPSANQFDPLVPARYSRWIKALEDAPPELQSWMLTQGNVTLTERFVAGDENPLRFSTRNASPRVEWFACALPAESPDEAFEMMMRMASERQFDLIVESANVQSCEEQDKGTAKIVFESSNKLGIQTNSEVPGWLLVRDTYYPGWQATLSGKPMDIAAGNYLFRAIQLPAGENEVILEYSPNIFKLGGSLTVLGLLLAGAFAYRIRRVRP